MRSFREAVLVAQHIVQHLGETGPDLVMERAHALRHAGDQDQARFWTTAAYAATVLASTPDTLALGAVGAGAQESAPDWRLMQSVEAYRHLARVAEVSRDPFTGGWGPTQLDAAIGWRELADDLHQLAGASDS